MQTACKKHGACARAARMRGISPVMRLTRCVSQERPAGSTSQERGGGWKWSLIHTKTKWHNDEINTNTVASLKPCGKRQQSPTCFHFVLTLTVTMSFWRTRAHVVKILYSAGCSVDRSSARGPFALQAGTWRPSVSTAWRWGLPFIYRLRANCYSRARAKQRCILCPLSAVKAFYSKYREQICSLSNRMWFKNTQEILRVIISDCVHPYFLKQRIKYEKGKITNAIVTFCLLIISNIFTTSSPQRAHVMKYELR